MGRSVIPLNFVIVFIFKNHKRITGESEPHVLSLPPFSQSYLIQEQKGETQMQMESQRDWKGDLMHYRILEIPFFQFFHHTL